MKICIIGGGAAGMMAAVAAGRAGHETVLLEQNEKLGKKLFITGKGRCNVTNACPENELMEHVVRNRRFLYSAFDAFSNRDMCDFLEEQGIRLKTERGNRVFPASDHSYDIIDAFRSAMHDCSVKVKLNTRAAKILTEEDDCGKKKILGVKCENGDIYRADRVILATGGCSYPVTGSDGYGFELAGGLGHTVTDLRPALVPLECRDDWIPSLQGLALKNVTFSLSDGKKTKFEEQGEMLFTHFGISGPIVLSASSLYEPGYTGFIDLKPGLNSSQLDDRLLRDFAEYSNKNFENALDGLFPKRLIPVMTKLSGIDPFKKVHQITGAERENFGCLIKHVPVNISGTRGFDEAIITRGGINVKEIDPRTMASKIVDGLSFAGEITDLDAVTGGYNLQIAWSTGFLAGSRADW